MAAPFPDHAFRAPRDQYEKDMKRIYRDVAPGFMALQDKIGAYTKDRAPIYREKEEAIRSIFRKMPTGQELSDMLAKVEMNLDEFYARYGEDKIRDAIFYAKDIKDRYSVLWVYYDTFGGEVLRM